MQEENKKPDENIEEAVNEEIIGEESSKTSEDKSDDENEDSENAKEEAQDESNALEEDTSDKAQEKAESEETDDSDKEGPATESDHKDEDKVESKLEGSHIFALRTTANREDQVMDFLTSNVQKKKLGVYTVIRPHGLRGYIFVEAGLRGDAEQAAFNVPYARGILPNEIQYNEIEHMLEQSKAEYNIKKRDIVEIISGAFKREQAKVSRIDKSKEEVVVELLQAAVPIPITLKIDAVKVIRREGDEDEE